MVGTLWKSASGILVCTEYKNGFCTLVYLDDPEYGSCIHTSRLRVHYTQLTQPTEET